MTLSLSPQSNCSASFLMSRHAMTGFLDLILDRNLIVVKETCSMIEAVVAVETL